MIGARSVRSDKSGNSLVLRIDAPFLTKLWGKLPGVFDKNRHFVFSKNGIGIRSETGSQEKVENS